MKRTFRVSSFHPSQSSQHARAETRFSNLNIASIEQRRDFVLPDICRLKSNDLSTSDENKVATPNEFLCAAATNACGNSRIVGACHSTNQSNWEVGFDETAHHARRRFLRASHQRKPGASSALHQSSEQCF